MMGKITKWVVGKDKENIVINILILTGANLKLNIMTAGMVNVTEWGLVPQQVLNTFGELKTTGLFETWKNVSVAAV